MCLAARVTVAAVCAFVAPLCLLGSGPLGVVGTPLFLLIAVACAADTLIEHSLFVLFLVCFLGGHEMLVAHCAISIGVPVATTVFIITSCGPGRLRAALARLFATPGTRGTIHARWFALGFWVVLFVAAQSPSYARSHYIRAWLLACLMMWALRWFVPRWEPARLARLSLAFSAQPLLYYLTPPDLIMVCYSPLTYVPIACVTIAALWSVTECWRDWRILSGRHPLWIMAERRGERLLLRQRVDQASYRESTQGSIVGSLPHRSPLGTDVCVAIVLCVVFQFSKLLLR